MSEQNESGNRWEKPADADDETTTDAGESPEAAPFETVAAQPPQEPTSEPVAGSAGGSRLTGWATRSRLIATGAAAAIFLGGGAAGYAVGNAGDDDHSRQFPGPAGFDRDGDDHGFGPGGQFPGGQVPGGQQAPQSQSGSSSDSGTAS